MYTRAQTHICMWSIHFSIKFFPPSRLSPYAFPLPGISKGLCVYNACTCIHTCMHNIVLFPLIPILRGQELRLSGRSELSEATSKE